MCKYTFLLPAYKGRFLDEMLNSIQSQTYKDFKVIISDDCSPEDLYSICQPYLCDDRFTYRRNVENMGGKDLVAHWNLLVNLCDTEWLIMASDDDLYEKSFLEEIDKLMAKHPQACIFRGRMKRIDENGICFDKESLYEEEVDQLQFIFDMYCSYYLRGIANCIFKTKPLQNGGGFVNFPLAWFSDDATIIQSSKNGLINTSKIVFSFRESLFQISCNKGNGNVDKLKAACSYLEWFKATLSKLPNEDSKFAEHRKSIVRKKSEDYIKRQINGNLGATSFSEMLSLYKWMKRNNFLIRKFEVYSFFKTWLTSNV